MRRDGREGVVDEVRRDLRPQRTQLGSRQALALGLELGQLDLRGDEARRLLDRARVLGGQPPVAREHRDERAGARAADDERRDDRRAERTARVLARDRGLDVHAVVAPGADELRERMPARVVIGAGAVPREHELAVGERDRRRLGQRQQARRGAGRGLLGQAAAEVGEHHRRRVERRLHRVALAGDHARAAQQPRPPRRATPRSPSPRGLREPPAPRRPG